MFATQHNSNSSGRASDHLLLEKRRTTNVQIHGSIPSLWLVSATGPANEDFFQCDYADLEKIVSEL